MKKFRICKRLKHEILKVEKTIKFMKKRTNKSNKNFNIDL